MGKRAVQANLGFDMVFRRRTTGAMSAGCSTNECSTALHQAQSRGAAHVLRSSTGTRGREVAEWAPQRTCSGL